MLLAGACQAPAGHEVCSAVAPSSSAFLLRRRSHPPDFAPPADPLPSPRRVKRFIEPKEAALNERESAPLALRDGARRPPTLPPMLLLLLPRALALVLPLAPLPRKSPLLNP